MPVPRNYIPKYGLISIKFQSRDIYYELERSICNVPMTDTSGSLYSDIESEPPMHRLNPKDGRCEQLNRRGEWARGGLARGLVQVIFKE